MSRIIDERFFFKSLFLIFIFKTAHQNNKKLNWINQLHGIEVSTTHLYPYVSMYREELKVVKYKKKQIY